MLGGGHVFAVGEEFLVHFFAGADAGVFDPDVAAGFSSRQADEVDGQVVYFDRFAHVQHEDFRASGHGTGLDDELNGFGYGHEVALHIGVGNGDRAASFDLFDEGRHDAAAAAQDVAEPDRGKAGFAGTVEILDDQLGQTFGRSHDAGGINGFVGRYKNEGLYPVNIGEFCNIFGADDVVVKCLNWMAFHHGYVFVGSGMENHLGVVFLKSPLQPGTVLYIQQQGDDFGLAVDLQQFLFDVKQVVLAVVTIKRRLGAALQIWRHSSEPMEPPAPVTRTVWPLM